MKTVRYWIVAFLLGLSQAQGNVRDNFYLGAGIDESLNHFELVAKNTVTKFSVERKKNHSKILGNVFLGYGYTTCRGFYVAAELGSYFPKRSVSVSRPGVTLTPFTFVDHLAVQDYLTGDLLLGVRPLDWCLFYLRGGGSWAHLTLDQSPNSVADTPSFHASNNKAGGRVGVGINFGCTRYFGLGLDYIFTQYQNGLSSWPEFDVQFTQKVYSHFIGISGIVSF